MLCTKRDGNKPAKVHQLKEVEFPLKIHYTESGYGPQEIYQHCTTVGML